MVDKKLTGLSVMLAKVGAETGQYSTETGVVADAFGADHGSLQKTFKDPLCLSYVFDTPRDSANFLESLQSNPEHTKFGDTTIPTLQIKRIEEYGGRKIDAVMVALPQGKGAEYVSTRLTSLAEKNGGRHVYTVGAPSTQPENDYKPWLDGPNIII